MHDMRRWLQVTRRTSSIELHESQSFCGRLLLEFAAVAVQAGCEIDSKSTAFVYAHILSETGVRLHKSLTCAYSPDSPHSFTHAPLNLPLIHYRACPLWSTSCFACVAWVKYTSHLGSPHPASPRCAASGSSAQTLDMAACHSTEPLKILPCPDLHASDTRRGSP